MVTPTFIIEPLFHWGHDQVWSDAAQRSAKLTNTPVAVQDSAEKLSK